MGSWVGLSFLNGGIFQSSSWHPSGDARISGSARLNVKIENYKAHALASVNHCKSTNLECKHNVTSQFDLCLNTSSGAGVKVALVVQCELKPHAHFLFISTDANQSTSMCYLFQYNLETNFHQNQQIILSFALPPRSCCSGSFLISSHASSSSSCTSCWDSDSLGIPCEEILRSGFHAPAASLVSKQLKQSWFLVLGWFISKHISGQIIRFHQPRFPSNKGISLPQLPFGCPGRVRSL